MTTPTDDIHHDHHEELLVEVKVQPQLRARIVALYALAGAVLVALGVVAISAVMNSGVHPFAKSDGSAEFVLGPIPAPVSMGEEAFAPIAAEDAVRINAGIPIANLSNPAATPFAPRASGIDSLRSTECMTAAIYYEAANEPTDGQRAVAQVILNRVRHPAFPKTVCGVVFQGSGRGTRLGCQFSFTCDGSLLRPPVPTLWNRARGVALMALSGSVYAPVGWATHYHANYVVPYWASTLGKVAVVGAHIFYRWNGGWGTAPAFRANYAGGEPIDLWTQAVTSAAMAAAGTAGGTALPITPDESQTLADAPRTSIRDLVPGTGGAPSPSGSPAPAAPTRYAIRPETAEPSPAAPVRPDNAAAPIRN